LIVIIVFVGWMLGFGPWVCMCVGWMTGYGFLVFFLGGGINLFEEFIDGLDV
jgi:hypothetical protein